MTSKSVLLTIPGLPFTVHDLFPNPRLMALAGALSAGGHETQVWDLGTMDTLERAYTEAMRAAAAECYAAHREPGSQMDRLRARFQARQIDRQLAQSMQALCARVAKRVVDARCDFVVVDVADERYWGPAKVLLDMVRRHRPALPLFACGPFAEAFHHVLLDHCAALDGVILADAEMAVDELAARIHAVDQWRFVPNLHYRGRVFGTIHRDFVQDLSTIPAPACHAEVYPALRGGQKLLLMPIEDARGAVFPSHARVQAWGPPLRPHAAPTIARLMQRMGETAHSYAFQFLNAEAPASLLRSVAAELVGRTVRAVYSRPCHVQCMDAATASALAVSGCQCVGFRLDTGSQRLLEDHYGHTFGLSEAEASVQAATRHGLHTTLYLTYPCPWEDRHTEAETLRAVRRMRPHGAHVAYPRVLPHTRWHTLASQFGYNHSEPCVAAWLTGRCVERGLSMHLRPPAPFGSVAGVGRGAWSLRAGLERALGSLGAACSVTMEGSMVAKVCGFVGRESSICWDLDRQLVSGDVDGLGEVIDRFNAHASTAGRLDARSFTSSQVAVGN